MEVFLCDWYPRKVVHEHAVAGRVPEVLRAWVRYGGRRRDLPEHLVADPIEAVDELEDEFRGAVTDPARYGPAKAILLAMRREGVDVTDEDEVGAWIEAFNARPTESRRLVLP